MSRVSEKQATFAALFAVAELGGRIYLPDVDVSDYGESVKRAVVADMHEAWAISAYVIERPFYGNNQHGWRLCRFCNGSGQSDIGPMFLTARDFNDAMRLVHDMSRIANMGKKR